MWLIAYYILHNLWATLVTYMHICIYRYSKRKRTRRPLHRADCLSLCRQWWRTRWPACLQLVTVLVWGVAKAWTLIELDTRAPHRPTSWLMIWAPVRRRTTRSWSTRRLRRSHSSMWSFATYPPTLASLRARNVRTVCDCNFFHPLKLSLVCNKDCFSLFVYSRENCAF